MNADSVESAVRHDALMVCNFVMTQRNLLRVKLATRSSTYCERQSRRAPRRSFTTISTSPI
ncbi:hypothetical protein X949_5972 [Burkholderia pseudomallei MSHR5609]|nr:hypothetical protein X949_5972 [Burkholderia pseudomallei MSHR5609]